MSDTTLAVSRLDGLDTTDPDVLLDAMEQDGRWHLDGLPAGAPTSELLDARLHAGEGKGLSGSAPVRATVTAAMLASGRLESRRGGPVSRERYFAIAAPADVPADAALIAEAAPELDLTGIELVTLTEAAELWGCLRYSVNDAVKAGRFDMGPNRPGRGPGGVRTIALTPRTLAHAARWTGEAAPVPSAETLAPTVPTNDGLEAEIARVEHGDAAVAGDGFASYGPPDVLPEFDAVAERVAPALDEPPVMTAGEMLVEPVRRIPADVRTVRDDDGVARVVSPLTLSEAAEALRMLQQETVERVVKDVRGETAAAEAHGANAAALLERLEAVAAQLCDALEVCRRHLLA